MADINLKNWSVFADGAAASAHDVNMNFAELRSLVTTTKLDQDNLLQPMTMFTVSATSWKGAQHKTTHEVRVKLPTGVGMMQAVAAQFGCADYDGGGDALAKCDIFFISTQGAGTAGNQVVDEMEADVVHDLALSTYTDIADYADRAMLPGGGVIVFSFSATSSGAGCDGFNACMWFKTKHLR
jgi:hypothetical protein